MSAPVRVHVLHVPGVDPLRDSIVHLLQQDADTCVHLDPERKGCMANWLTAVACAATEENDWATILSDDALPLPGWQRHLDQATFYSPEPVLGLTHFGGYGEAALKKRTPYAVGPYLLWGGAIAYHHSFLTGLARWAPKVAEKLNYQHDDCLTAAYAMKQGRLTAMTARAIFDQPAEVRSLLGHFTSVRTPSRTIDNSLGPAYSLGTFTRVSRGISPKDELYRLAAL